MEPSAESRLRPAPVLWVNGRQHPFRPGMTVADLLAELGAGGPGVAVERNRQVVRRQEQGEVRLAPDDRIEIVRLVGGG